jgi:hypothetical protein
MFMKSTTLFTGGADRCIKAWLLCPVDGDEAFQLIWSKRSVFEDRVLAIHADETHVAVASQDRRFAIMAVADGSLLRASELERDHAVVLRLAPRVIEGASSRRQLLAMGTAFRRVQVHDCTRDPPQLLHSIVIADARALTLVFAHEIHRDPRHAAENFRPTANYASAESAVDDSSPRAQGPSKLALGRTPARRSSLGSRQNSSPVAGALTVAPASAATDREQGALIVGLTDGSVLNWRWFSGGEGREHLVSSGRCLGGGGDRGGGGDGKRDAAKGRVSEDRGGGGEGGDDVLVEELAPSLRPPASPLSDDPSARVRTTLVAKLFAEVTAGAVGRWQSPAQLLEVVEALEKEVASIEATADRRGVFESALPGLGTFRERLVVARACPSRPDSTTDRCGGGGGGEPLNDPLRSPSAEGQRRGGLLREPLRSMIGEFRQHLHHLLTFPSPTWCNALDLDLGRGLVYTAGLDGITRRQLRQPSLGQKGGPTGVPTGGLTGGLTGRGPSRAAGLQGGWCGAPRALPILERPFVHSDLDPHCAVYRLVVDTSQGVLYSLGKDRLLRVWDLHAATILRCLPAAATDAPVAAAGSCVAVVTGDRARAVKAWAAIGRVGRS